MLCFSLSASQSFSSSLPLPPFSAPSIASRSPGIGIVVFASHSNPRILKTNRRSPYGRGISPYSEDGDDDDEDDEEEEDSEDEDDSSNSDECSSDRHFNQKRLNLIRNKPDRKRGNKKSLGKGQEVRFPKSEQQSVDDLVEISGMGMTTKGQLKSGSFTENNFQMLIEELDFDEKWFPLIDYLSTFGLKESHFKTISERHMPCLQINLASAQERLEFLISSGVKQKDVKRILMRQPQILEYTVENNLKSHVAFLIGIGVPHSRIGQIITAAPSLFSYSVEHSLKPTIRYLVEEVGIKESEVSKVIQLSPQVLVQRIDNSWTSRFCFLSKELGAPRDNIVKMVTKHPQLLHYSIEDGISPRINFLRSIGMRNADILKVLTSLTQVLSLSLEDNLKPKYLYLVNELRNEVKSLTKYPMYLSLSLEQRIRPRHKFLVSLKKAPKGPFPLSSLVPTDESFCQQWAGTSLETYLEFKSLLITNFAKKYEKKR